MRIKRITSDTQISTAPIIILGYQMFPDGSNTGVVEFYNEADSSKTAASKISAGRCIATESKEAIFPSPLYCENGLYVDLTGTNLELFVYLK